jgi:large subunit ribosomal protein L17
MACSLIEHKRITTTLAKAKTLRVFIEPILTKSKTDSTHSRRVVFSYLQNKEIVSELFRDIAPKIAERNGGYTRIIRTGNRLGDNAEMCLIELVDFNELYSNATLKKTTRRSRRGTTKKVDSSETSEIVSEESSSENLIEDAVVVDETDTNADSTTENASAEAENTETPEASEDSSDDEKKAK